MMIHYAEPGTLKNFVYIIVTVSQQQYKQSKSEAYLREERYLLLETGEKVVYTPIYFFPCHSPSLPGKKKGILNHFTQNKVFIPLKKKVLVSCTIFQVLIKIILQCVCCTVGIKKFFFGSRSYRLNWCLLSVYILVILQLVFLSLYPEESGYSLWNWNKKSCLWNSVLGCADKRWSCVYFWPR